MMYFERVGGQFMHSGGRLELMEIYGVHSMEESREIKKPDIKHTL